MAENKRFTLDCRKSPEAKGCSLAISGTEQEVMDVAAYHAAKRHGLQDTPENRKQLRGWLQEERTVVASSR